MPTLAQYTPKYNEIFDSLSILASLNLPACIESTGDAGLPESIREKAAAVREAGGLAAIRRLMADLPDLLQRNREILTEVRHSIFVTPLSPVLPIPFLSPLLILDPSV